MEIINVPDIEGPIEQLCWKQNFPTHENPVPSNALARCDRRKEHDGQHTWELTERLRALQEELTVLRANRRSLLDG